MIQAMYLEHMSSDLGIVNAARFSFGTQYTQWSETPRTKRGRSDRELMYDLARDGHLLPFRHAQVKLACTAPVPVARQLGKHQVGFSWSETSRRYKTGGMTFHHIDQWRAAPVNKRQGSGLPLPAASQRRLEAVAARLEAESRRAYDYALAEGASPEQARFFLLQSMNVDWVWTGSLLGWADLVHKRTHPDVQRETEDFARAVANVIEPLFPVAWEALMTAWDVKRIPANDFLSR